MPGTPGRSGRKPIHDQIKARNLCLQAIEEQFGSLIEGLKVLLASNEPSLIKFVFEHAMGKPPDRIESDVVSLIEQVQIIQLPDNGRDYPINDITPPSEN